VLRTLRQPRYVALSILMLIVALACCAAGSWQVYRLAQKAHWNAELRHNAHAAPVPLDGFVPLTGSGSHPSTHHIQFHTVTVSGTYDTAHVWLVREATVNNESGFYVLTPLRTSVGVLLVVRGFIAQSVSSAAIPTAPAPPACSRPRPATTARSI
jgi:cytochrome oxidase assembly protein ShyY1